MLMDEPLSALDRNAKEEILPYLESLHEALDRLHDSGFRVDVDRACRLI